jgi:hypothetical protein
MSGTEKKRRLFYKTFLRFRLDNHEVIPPQSFPPRPAAPRISSRWLSQRIFSFLTVYGRAEKCYNGANCTAGR